jgi:hypothetical protein
LEKLNIRCDKYATFPAIIADEGVMEIAVKRAECIGLTNHGSMNHWIIIRIRRHNTGSSTRENNL